MMNRGRMDVILSAVPNNAIAGHRKTRHDTTRPDVIQVSQLDQFSAYRYRNINDSCAFSAYKHL
jgi:hypothetical protein